jgi:Zn-dependent protease
MGSAGTAAALRFSLIGFPVRIEASFVVLLALLGFGLSAHHIALWVAIGTVSILAHELGHALVAPKATISLQGLGGLTQPRRATPFSRKEDALVSVAGPAAGLLLGAAVLAAWLTLRWDYDTTGGWILAMSLFTTAGWSVFNLLPILPLDGGHLLVAALPGAAAERQLKAARVSVAIAAAGAFLAYRTGWTYSILFAAMLGAQNLATIKQLKQHLRLTGLSDLYRERRYDEVIRQARATSTDASVPLADRAAAHRYILIALIAAERTTEAAAELRDCPDDLDLGAAFVGYVMAATGNEDLGVSLARQAVEDDPSGDNVHWCFQALLRTGDRAGAAALAAAHPGLLDPDVARTAQE